MNKAKAYRRLRERSGCLRQCWEHRNGQQLQQLGSDGASVNTDPEALDNMAASSVKERHDHLLKLRHSRPLKALLSNDTADLNHLNSKAPVDFLPHIQPCFSLSSSLPEKPVDNEEQVSEYLRRPETTRAAAPLEWNLLQSKTQSYASPFKRKASRSYSSCSSSLQIKKLTVYSTNKENGPSETGSTGLPDSHDIKFPAASKMRQLLKSDNKQLEAVGKLAPKHQPLRLNLSREKITLAPLQMIAKQRPLSITTSQNPLVTNYPAGESSNLSRRLDTVVRKHVKFAEKNGAVRPKTDSAGTTAAKDPFQSAGVLILTTQNLELYNSVANSTELSTPSNDDDRIASWIQERQVKNRLDVIYDDIPEVEENGLEEHTADVESTIPSV